MVSTNISLKKEAYEFLNSLKTGNKSFSEIILEFRDNRRGGTTKDLLKFAGVLKGKNIDFEERLKRMKEFRESFNKHLIESEKYARAR